ncbi:unnamed protein product [Brassica napus]|uniref:(rape) hypothetical protein n=1 Tax=Brassica napus TaxID=3708 RepID=A0A816MVR1_BRANA|nr:unnamed protein product [Brassica napus]
MIIVLRYVKSRSDQQLLHGQEYTHTSACKLEESSNGLPVVPCGLIAWSMLYDTNFSRERTKLKVSRNDTAWKSDHEHKFRKNVFPFNFQNGTLISGPKLDPKVTMKLILSTSSWLGGRKDFLGITYLVVGASSIIISIIFMLLHLKNPR